MCAGELLYGNERRERGEGEREGEEREAHLYLYWPVLPVAQAVEVE